MTNEIPAPDTADKARPLRPVPAALAIGILIAPIIFAWALLRPGYSALARVLAFAWLAVSFWVAAAMFQSPPQGVMNSLPETAAVVQAEPAPSLRPGDPVALGPLIITFQAPTIREKVGITGIEERASEGGVLILVRYTTKNVSAAPAPAADLPQITLIDPQGTTYSPDAGKTGAYALGAKSDQKLWSDLNPGITVSAAQVFEISKETYDPATWRIVINGGEATVAMQ